MNGASRPEKQWMNGEFNLEQENTISMTIEQVQQDACLPESGTSFGRWWLIEINK